MEDTSSCESSLESSNKQDWRETEFVNDSGNEKAAWIDAGSFRSIMSKREMEILAAWFPKCARTLAAVLRNHCQVIKPDDRFWIDDER